MMSAFMYQQYDYIHPHPYNHVPPVSMTYNSPLLAVNDPVSQLVVNNAFGVGGAARSRREAAQLSATQRWRDKKKIHSSKTLRCNLCDIEVPGEVAYRTHCAGHKHLRRLKDKEYTTKGLLPGDDICVMPGEMFSCKLCNATLNCASQVQDHLNGSKHQRKMERRMKDNRSNNCKGTKKPLSEEEEESLNRKKIKKEPERIVTYVPDITAIGNDKRITEQKERNVDRGLASAGPLSSLSMASNNNYAQKEGQRKIIVNEDKPDNYKPTTAPVMKEDSKNVSSVKAPTNEKYRWRIPKVEREVTCVDSGTANGGQLRGRSGIHAACSGAQSW